MKKTRGIEEQIYMNNKIALLFYFVVLYYYILYFNISYNILFISHADIYKLLDTIWFLNQNGRLNTYSLLNEKTMNSYNPLFDKIIDLKATKPTVSFDKIIVSYDNIVIFYVI